MSDDGKVVFLAFSSPKVEVAGIERLSCKSCRNKTFVVTYDQGVDFPALKCACCGADCGRIGWAPEAA